MGGVHAPKDGRPTSPARFLERRLRDGVRGSPLHPPPPPPPTPGIRLPPKLLLKSCSSKLERLYSGSASFTDRDRRVLSRTGEAFINPALPFFFSPSFQSHLAAKWSSPLLLSSPSPERRRFSRARCRRHHAPFIKDTYQRAGTKHDEPVINYETIKDT